MGSTNGRESRVGLVLGAGGIQGGAWLTGGLDALARETGWDPADGRRDRRHLGRLDDRRARRRRASRPGSWSPTRAGETFDGVVDATGPPRRRGRPRRRRHLQPRARPGRRSARGRGAWRCASLAEPAPLPAGRGGRRLAAARGFISTEPLKDIVRRVVPEGWSPHPNLWVVACDYATGRRVAVRAPRVACRRSSPTPSPPRARSPASTTRSRSAAAATWTAACTRPRTSTSSATRTSTS